MRTEVRPLPIGPATANLWKRYIPGSRNTPPPMRLRPMIDHAHSDDDEVEERFQTLESKLSHTEYTVDELNTVVTRQQDQIDALTREIKILRAAMADDGEPSIEGGEEPPPPHY